jgi:hypothetical protein
MTTVVTRPAMPANPAAHLRPSRKPGPEPTPLAPVIVATPPATAGYNSRVYAHRFGTTRPHTLAGAR